LASGTEIVCALGGGEFLVGRSHECDNPSWVASLPVCTRPAFDVNRSSGEIDGEVKRRLSSDEPLFVVDADLINALRPDVLIAQVHCGVCAVTPGDVKNSGDIAVARLLELKAGTVRGIYDDIHAIGRALRLEDRAAQLVTTMENRIDGVRAALQG